jgi:hypothetical protein
MVLVGDQKSFRKCLFAIPTLTDVLPSSSDALLPPPTLLVILIRLLLLGGFIIALMGRCGKPDGDSGGELAMALL